MCGIVAVVTKAYNGFNAQERDSFSDMLWCDVFRGDDSTGVMLISNRGNVSTAKEASSAPIFMQRDEYDQMCKDAFRDGGAMVGHNRKATRGVVNDANAHPFIADERIVLVHNGTLFGDHKKLADVEVDSEAIAHTLLKHDGDAEKALSEIDGAYALVWYDTKLKQLNFVRNGARPLAVVETPTAWYFASERRMAEWIVNRNSNVTNADYTGRELDIHKMMTFTKRGQTWDMSEKQLNIVKKSTSTTSYPSSNAEWYEQNWGDACGYDNMVMGGVAQRRRFPHEHAAAWEDADDNTPSNVLTTPRVSGGSQSETVVDAVARSLGMPALPAPVKGLSNQKLLDITAKIKSYDWERDLIIAQGKVIESEDFLYDTQQIRSGCWETAIPFDYHEFSVNGVCKGWFVYAVPVDDADWVIRCFIRESDIANGESDIVAMCVQGNPYSFCIRTKGWSLIKGVEGLEEKMGYGILYADDMARVTTVGDSK